jgi:hypothetical protein
VRASPESSDDSGFETRVLCIRNALRKHSKREGDGPEIDGGDTGTEESGRGHVKLGGYWTRAACLPI